MRPTLHRLAQDLPPEGGYEPIQYKRNIPARGFRPSIYLFGMSAIVVWGLVLTGKGIREKNELAREKLWSRIHLTPLLQAEEDRDQVRRHWADKAREKELLGEETRVYHSDRFVRPTFALVPDLTKEAGTLLRRPLDVREKVGRGEGMGGRRRGEGGGGEVV